MLLSIRLLFVAILSFCNITVLNADEETENKPPAVLLFGPPGSGQGVLAVKVSKAFAIPHISSADLVAKEITESTEIGQKVRNFLNRSGSLPDELFLDMFYERIDLSDCKHGFLLSGLPRTLEQAKAIHSCLNSTYDLYAISIDISDEILQQRASGRLVCQECGRVYHKDFSPPRIAMKCDQCSTTLVQREDDSAETLKRKLQDYHNAIKPVLAFYKEQGKLREVRGNLGIDETLDEIKATINKR